MCYFLHGAINEGVNVEDYKSDIEKFNYYFNFGNANDINESIKNGDDKY